MTVTSDGVARMASPAGNLRWLPLTLALREMRGGLRGFAVFIGCIALGVMAIAGVGSFSRSLVDGINREGRVILGGDVAVTLIGRELNAPERAFLDRAGDVSVAATMRAMARFGDDRSSLVELKSVDGRYPLIGRLAIEPAQPLAQALGKAGDGVFGAVADETLFSRFDLKPGDRIRVGEAMLELRAMLRSEPDKLAGGVEFGPRLMIAEDALRATGLVQPGSIVRWHYRLRLPGMQQSDVVAGAIADKRAETVVAAARGDFPDAGWDIRTGANASPQLARSVERFTQYLTLVGLTALLVGGIGVANATRFHLDRKRDVIATLKSVGASGVTVVTIYLLQIVMLTLVGVAIGLVAGAALPFIVSAVAGRLIPLPFEPGLHLPTLAVAAAYGLLTAVAFALWPLARAHDVPASALFRDAVAPERPWPRLRYVAAGTGAAAALAALAILAAYDRKIAVIFIVASLLVFALLRAVAALTMLIARRAPRARRPMLRLAVANIHRPSALTTTVMMSLGLGLAVLVTVLQIDGNLRMQFASSLPARAPSFYFLDIPPADADAFDALVRARAPQAELERVPMLRGRIIAARGVRAEQLRPSEDGAWVLQGDRGITFTNEVPAGSRVVEGEWWKSDYDGPPLISFEKKLADALSLKLGDDVTVNVFGRNITGRIANLRSVDWQSLGINFVLVFSPSAFRGAPHTDIATVTYPGGGGRSDEIALLKASSDAFPTVTAVRVKDAIDAVAAIVNNLVFAIRIASSLTLVAAVLVLGGALAAGHRHRVYDAVILKTLGATRGRLLGAYALEYMMLGVAAAAFGVLAGSIAAWRIIVDVMNLQFQWQAGLAGIAAVTAIVITVLFGLFGTYTALGRKAAPVLRSN